MDEEFENPGCLSWSVLTVLFIMLMTGLILGLLMITNQLL